MLFQKYILKNLKIKEKLPFEIITRKFKQGERITDIGTQEQNIYYVVSGIVETCIVTKYGDKIVEFTFANGLVTSLTSLLKNKPSSAYLSCLKDCKVQVIPYAKLNEACNTSLVANKFYKYFLENYYLARIKKATDALSKDAEERYLDLLKNKPHIMSEVPVSHIAKYIGIHPNSLSRIRKKYLPKKVSQ